jgi:hypothetical protein
VRDDEDAERVSQLRHAIAHHLKRYPNAGDTPDGIIACWVPRRGFEDAPHYINDVIEEMVAAGELVPRNLPDGRVLYVRGPCLDDAE